MKQVLDQVLQPWGTEQLQAGPYKRSDKRQGYRNSTMPHTFTTHYLAGPRLRSGRFSPDLLFRYQRSEQALVLASLKMAVNGALSRPVCEFPNCRWRSSTLAGSDPALPRGPINRFGSPPSPAAGTAARLCAGGTTVTLSPDIDRYRVVQQTVQDGGGQDGVA